MQKATSSSRLYCTVICIMCICVLTYIEISLQSHIFPEKANAISNKDKVSSLCQYLCASGVRVRFIYLFYFKCLYDEVRERLTNTV